MTEIGDQEGRHCRIKIYTLGRFSLVIDGRPITFQKRAQQRPLALLKVLIAFGGREVPEETISYALWPESEGDKAHEAFASALKRLRKFIGVHGAVRLSNKCLTLDSHCSWVDIWGFERFLGQTEQHTQYGEMDEALRCFEKAERLYNGEFLSGDLFEAWARKIRERLQHKFLRQICHISDYLCKKKKYHLAMAYCQKGLQIDELSEGLYQRVILCYRCCGQYGEALTTYHRLTEILSSTFGIDPSPKSFAMIKAIKNGTAIPSENVMSTIQ